ncbi:histidine phosphatase family protein [Rhodococcus qingshengii]|uniref:histidine phosphatase family protein n=1 Tax=Rhodococcus TaxID=1827 RepID=UPI0005A82D93|nr:MULTISPECIES: histidine phosphatase family protein [Rhodococcus]KLN67496.1 phosphoglycerate kinase [Rhodococcus erythropolis]MBQ7803218.1 histidine phosphatase family protein [Rhodococcus sp. (in: high G+C Gram-positive bacteria)]MCD2135564.1 histidine phosphatase family protein [Rhodococcus qingshengii]
MQLLLIRHALPELAEVTEGRADPSLTDEGRAQALRLPAALAPYRITGLFSSPQKRALETAAPVAQILGLPVTQREGLAEYDYEQPHYIPMHEVLERVPETYARIKAGWLPESVDGDAFRARVLGAIDEIVAATDNDATVAIFCHGGVVNIVLQELLGLERPLTFPIEYVSVTRILVSRNGSRRVGSINETGHVRNMLRV